MPEDAEPEIETVPAVLTCRTPECILEGQPIETVLAVNADGVWRAVCGPCEKPITDIEIKGAP